MDEANRQSLSIVVPVKDESESLPELHRRISTVMSECGLEDYTILMVDDGSTDDSWSIMKTLAETDPDHFQALRLRRNFGKATALAAAFDQCRGDIVITMDADLQDEPGEIPRFIERINAGYDLVSGWKEHRRDPLQRKLASRLFNRVTARLTGVDLSDFNCGFKAYRKEVINGLNLYGDMHRYIPVLAHAQGFRIAELSVQHNPRRHGRSRYGLERYGRGLLDLFAVLMTTRFLKRPGHLFGGLGLLAGVAGFTILGYMAVLWFLGLGPIGTRPLFFVGLLAVILSLQLLSIGLLGELITHQTDTGEREHLIAARIGTHPSP